MREFAFSGTVASMSRRTLAALTVLAGCTSPAYKLFLEHGDDAGDASTADSEETDEHTTAGSDATPTSSGSVDSQGGDGSTTGSADTDSSTDATSGGSTSVEQDPPVGDAQKPEIVGVVLPADVFAAGPVPISVNTEHTAAVHVLLDGVDAGELVAAGDGIFTGELPVHGAIDNGMHEVEVVATQGEFEDHSTAYYNVKTPTPGTEAWSQGGPEGSRTNRVAVTPEGDLIEVGQTEIAGVAHPTIRKRSGVTGAELWPEGTITLDSGEGAVVDVAMLPDGRMWVAMNVREPMKDPRPRFALLDPDGHVTDADVLGTTGRVVRAIAADADGSCFAVGLAGVMGDWDFAYWRIDAEGVQTLGDTYDYRPDLQDIPHSFRDVAADVVIDGGIAWTVGFSQGPHVNEPIRTRGVLVPMDLHTGEVVGPVIVALNDALWLQNGFFGGARHPEGLLVTGYGCDAPCDLYRIETSLYSPAGARLGHIIGTPNDGLTFGSDVVFDGQDRVLVAGAVMQNGKLRGYVFGGMFESNGPYLLEHWYPGLGPSEALGIARDEFDRIFPVGYITVNGEEQGRVTLIHG
jgi:hypothetical protein